MEGLALHLSRQSRVGYTGVIRKGKGYALRRSSRYSISGTVTYATVAEAALAYAKAVAATNEAAAQREAAAAAAASAAAAAEARLVADSDLWLSPTGIEHVRSLHPAMLRLLNPRSSSLTPLTSPPLIRLIPLIPLTPSSFTCTSSTSLLTSLPAAQSIISDECRPIHH